MTMRLTSLWPIYCILIYEGFASHKQCLCFISQPRAKLFLTDDRWHNSRVQNQCLLVPGGTLGLWKWFWKNTTPCQNLICRSSRYLCDYILQKYLFASKLRCYIAPQMVSQKDLAFHWLRTCSWMFGSNIEISDYPSLVLPQSPWGQRHTFSMVSDYWVPIPALQIQL